MKNYILLFCVFAAGGSFAAPHRTVNESLAFFQAAERISKNATVADFLNETWISHFKIIDAEFEFLVPLCLQSSKVKVLDFRFAQISGKGFEMLAEECGTWPSVTHIDIAGNPLEERFLSYLNMFPNLEHLNIDHDRKEPSTIRGDFLRSLNLPRFNSIYATGINLSDENALFLLQMPIESFNFRGTQISANTLEKLEAKKINIVKRPWDIRRVAFEIKNSRKCQSQFNDSKRERHLKRGLKWGVLSPAAAEEIRKNPDFAFFIIVDDDDGEIWDYRLCESKEADQEEL